MVVQQKSSGPGDSPGIKTDPSDEWSGDKETSRPTGYQRLVEVMMKKEVSCSSLFQFPLSISRCCYLDRTSSSIY